MTLSWIRVSRWPNWSAPVVIVGMAWLALAGVATMLAARARHSCILCPLRRLTSVPCPFCGTGRAALAVCHGGLVEAWLLNPLVVTVAGIGTVVLAARLALGRTIRLDLTPGQSRCLRALGAVALAANWLYVIRYLH